jgi:nucleoside-diphosphate-sugar epimerase
MKILLTGATGFLGSNVLRILLQKGYDVRALRRANSRMDLVADIAHRVEWLEMDITDIALEEAFEGITHVCHCAAIVSFHPRDAKRMNQINVDGTANLVNLSLDFGIQRFVHTSSIAALGRSKERTHLDESTKWEASKLNSNYAISKYGAEQEVWRGAAEGLSVAIVNPAMVIGSGFWDENTARFFTQIKNGLKFCPVGATGFVDVRDVADFMVRLLESDIAGERFVLVSENLSYKTFFAYIAAALNVKPPSITVQPWLAEIAWRIEWLKEKILGTKPMVTKESARSSVYWFTYGNEKSLAAFKDFKYRKIADTIRDAAAAFRAHTTN